MLLRTNFKHQHWHVGTVVRQLQDTLPETSSASDVEMKASEAVLKIFGVTSWAFHWHKTSKQFWTILNAPQHRFVRDLPLWSKKWRRAASCKVCELCGNSTPRQTGPHGQDVCGVQEGWEAMWWWYHKGPMLGAAVARNALLLVDYQYMDICVSIIIFNYIRDQAL